MNTAMQVSSGPALARAEHREGLGADIERVLVDGDLSALTPSQRVTYYHAVCNSAGLNPLTKPFDYLRLNGKLVLYPNKGCAEQLRMVHGVSLSITNTSEHKDVYVVTVSAKDRSGREDGATGAVPVGNLKGDALANAFMKAETKAKRRATLSICGMNMLDETEIETIPSARKVTVTEDGEIIQDISDHVALAESLLKYNSRIDEANTVDDLMSIYNDARSDKTLRKENVELVKRNCGNKRKQIEVSG